MQTQPTSNLSLQFPMHELELIESIIKACSQWLARPQWLAILENRSAVLLAELERITRPQPVLPRLVAKTIRRGYEYRGIVHKHRNCIGIHVGLLRLLWAEFPDRRQAMAGAMGQHRGFRPYVAKTRAELFPGQTQVFSYRYGRMLVDDWYVDTNLNPRQMHPILSVAVAAAGLKLDEEIKIYWP